MNLDILTILGAFAAFAIFIWGMFEVFSKRVIKPIEVNTEKIEEIDNKFTGEIRSIHTKITEITKEIRPNGGSSMKDVQQKIYESVRILHDRDTFNFYLDNQPKFECDVNGMCIRVNDAFSDLTGVTETNAMGNGWFTFINERSIDEFLKGWEFSVEKCTPFMMRVLMKDGRLVKITTKSNGKTDKHRMIVGALELV